MARFLGIDVGENALRGVLVRSALRKLEVERYVQIPLAEPPRSPGRLPELAEAGRNLLLALKTPPDAIVAAVPGEDVSLRVLDLPAAARKRIGEVLPFELEALLPYDPHDAVIDHQPARTAGPELQVLAAAVLRPRVQSLLDELRHAGLEPRELAAGAAALDGLSILVPELAGELPVLVIDLGDHRTDLCLLAAGSCVAARTLDFGIEDMPGAADATRRELARTMLSFRSGGVAAPTVAYLCGSGSVAEDAASWLASALAIEVKLLALPSSTSGPASPVFGKAAALAARGAVARRRINLRIGEFASTNARGSLIEHVNLIVTCTVVVVMTAMFALKARQMLLADEQRSLREELAAVTQEAFGKSIEDPAEAQALVEDPKFSDPLPRFDAYDAFAAISAAVPSEISHEVRRLRIDVADEKREGQVELQGVLDSLTQRDEVVAGLEKHPCFREIQLGRTTPAGTGDRINYQIEALVRCPGEADPKGKKKKPEDEP
jgi:general secretion pathway protein L